MSDFHDPKKYWLDEPKNVKKIIWAVVTICGLLFVLDGFYDKHPHFEVEGWFGFYAIYGFVMCVMLVLVAKWMRTFLMRDEGYYDDDE